MADRANIPVETLRQLLAYDPATGKLTWLERAREMFATQRHCSVWNARYAGNDALTAHCRGHRHGNILGQTYKAHRVAWAIHHGGWPAGDLDHINGDPADNRICNLRVVDHQTNMRNVKRRTDSTSGIPGVCWFKPKRKWMVRVGHKHIGYFDTLEAASEARQTAAAAAGYHPNHGRAACPK